MLYDAITVRVGVDPPRTTGRQRPKAWCHTTREDAAPWTEASNLRTTSNCEHYEEFTLVEVGWDAEARDPCIVVAAIRARVVVGLSFGS